MDKISERLTLYNGVEIPRLGFGVWQIPPLHTAQCVKTAIKKGYRNIDTVEGYMNKKSILTEKADLEVVLEEVKRWDFVDADSIYLMGNSQGGLVTALTASEHREEIRAVILIYPEFCIYDDVHEMFDSPEEIPETHSLLGLRLGNRYFVNIWDQEPYERIKE